VRILNSVINGPEPCSYLSGQFSAMEYARIGGMEAGDYTRRLGEGWFKFGSFLQRPLCHWCRRCYSMRVPLDEWEPSRAHRRILRRNAAAEVSVSSPPVFSKERLSLYNRYRTMQAALRGWQPANLTETSYMEEFVRGPAPMTEISIHENGRLLAVLMADEDPDLITAVTHFHDPALWKRSIGLYTVLQAFLYAKRLGKKWLYLGYFVPGSPSMDYKKQFHPCELRQWNGEWLRVAEPRQFK
jgi:arginyl-tRNA--protein-N-Asp/Glu arginylyltransferase